MGWVFDRNTTGSYDSWYKSFNGHAIDEAIGSMFRYLARPKPNERLLEIGCGTGNHLIVFNRQGLDISGIDASSSAIEIARERLGHRAYIRRAEAEDLPFEDNEFDLAVFINTLEYLENPLQALKEAGRVARRQVFITVLNSLSWNGVIKRAQGLLGHPLFWHAKLLNIWQLKSLLNSAFGNVLTSWGGIKTRPYRLEKIGLAERVTVDYKPSLLCSFLCVSATMICRVKTDNLPLTVRLKKAGSPLVGVNTWRHLKGFEEARENERSSSL